MEHVEGVARPASGTTGVEKENSPRPDEAIVACPGGEAGVEDGGEGVDRVEAEEGGEEADGVVEGRLQWVHAGPGPGLGGGGGGGPGGGVVRLVVEAVDLPVQELPYVRNSVNPGFHVLRFTGLGTSKDASSYGWCRSAGTSTGTRWPPP